MKSISKTDFGKLIGVSASMVTKYLSAGLPNEGGKIEPIAGCRWVRDNIMQPSSANSLNEVRKRGLLVDAKTKEFKLDVAQKKYLLAVDAEAAFGLVCGLIKRRLLQMAGSLSAKVAPITDPRECLITIDRAVKNTLDLLANHPFDARKKCKREKK
jgi:hypothetical protein